jgi:tetratricopeptide (TPR) repeat protein
MYSRVSDRHPVRQYRFRRIILSSLFGLLASLFLSGTQTALGQQDLTVLEKGKPIEREISGDGHSYQLQINSGQYLHISIEQQGIDLVASVFNPSGDQVIEASTLNRQQGNKQIYLVAETSGNYRLDLRPAEKDLKPGRYQIKIEEIRPATAQDRNQAAARRAFADGERLRAQATKDSMLKALEKYEAVLPHWRAMGDRDGEAATLNSIGSICFSFGENRKGLDYLSQSLRLWRMTGNRYWEVATLNSMGNAHNLLGENQKALDYYSQALLLINAVGDRRGEAVTLNGIGKVYADIGENQRALDCYTQALILRRLTGDRRGEAITLHNMGNIYDNLIDNKRALEYYNQAIDIFRSVNDQRGESSSLNNAARIYVDMGEYQKAIDYFNNSLALKQAVGDRRAEAATLNNIGYIYVLMGEKKDSSSYFIGSAVSLSNHKQQALNYLNQALPIWRSVGDKTEEAATLSVMSKIYGALGEFQKARDLSNQAVALKQSLERSTETAAARSTEPPPPPVAAASTSAHTPAPVTPPAPVPDSAPVLSVQPQPVQTAQESRPRLTKKTPKSNEVIKEPLKQEVELKRPAGKGRYVVQVASSPDRTLAEGLLERLRGAGVEGYIVQANLSGKGTWYRVRTGRYENSEEAKKAATLLKSKGLIADFFITTE